MREIEPDRERAYERETIRMTERLKREIGYNPTRWMQMVGEHAAIEASRRFLGDDFSDGLVKLWDVHWRRRDSLGASGLSMGDTPEDLRKSLPLGRPRTSIPTCSR